MSNLKSKMHVRDATVGVQMTIHVAGVRAWKLRNVIALRLIKLATIVSPIVTKVEISNGPELISDALIEDAALAAFNALNALNPVSWAWNDPGCEELRNNYRVAARAAIERGRAADAGRA